jgi:hypothetical protein
MDEKSFTSIGGMTSYFIENSKSASPDSTFWASASSSVMSISGCVADFSPRSARHGARRLAQDLVDDLGHEGLAVHLAQMLNRNLAGAKALELHLALGVFQAVAQLWTEGPPWERQP